MVKNRQLAGENKGAVANSLTSELDAKNQMKELLYYFSVFEVHELRRSGDTAFLSRFCILGLNFSIVVSGILLSAIVIDSMTFDGVYSTTLITMFLLISFYIFYEYMRISTLSKVSVWTKAELQTVSSAVFEEMNARPLSLRHMLEINGISDEPTNLASGSRSVSLVDTIKPEVPVNDHETFSLANSGYLTILLLLSAAMITSLVVIGIGSTRLS